MKFLKLFVIILSCIAICACQLLIADNSKVRVYETTKKRETNQFQEQDVNKKYNNIANK
jgi:hypothetical protein